MSKDIQVFVNKNDWFLSRRSGYQSNKYMYAYANEASLEGREKCIKIWQGISTLLQTNRKKSPFDFHFSYIRSRELEVVPIHMRMKPQLEGREKSIKIWRGKLPLQK